MLIYFFSSNKIARSDSLKNPKLCTGQKIALLALMIIYTKKSVLNSQKATIFSASREFDDIFIEWLLAC